MKITVTPITGIDLARIACAATVRGHKEAKISKDKLYKCMHSPIRCIMFWVTMEQIKTFVSVHFVRHSPGVSHFVQSNRTDRGGEKADRDTLIDHSMFLNAEALINMARKRLCGAASEETQQTMQSLKDSVALVDPDLAKYMVRECEFRNGICSELRCCGNLFKPNNVK